jgi:hypothetical protein
VGASERRRASLPVAVVASRMARGLAPLTVLVLLFGCFKAGGDDDEIGATEDTGDTTEESTSESTSEDSTSEDSTEDSTEDTTTGPDCGPGEMACGQDCTDLDNDPDHCGACDHSCLGGECVSGTCQAVELANSKGRLFMVVVDDDHLYYGGDGVDVGRMDKDGGNDTILITAGADPMMNEYCYDWALTPFAVVWGNDWLQPGVRGCVLPDCEGGVQTFVPGLNLFGMTYHEDSATLYWNQGDEIHQRTWPGGTPSVFLGMAGNPRSMTTDDAFVYWTAALAANDAHLRKSPLDGGPFVELAIDRPDAGDIEVGPDFIYWAEGSQIYFAPLPNGIGGGAPPPFGSSGTTVRRTAIDDTHLYWTSTSMDIGTIQRCPLDGCAGAPEVLGQSQQPWGITLDQDAVYWVTEQGSIFKVAK